MRSSLIRYLFWRIALIAALCWLAWYLHLYGVVVVVLLLLFNSEQK